MPETGREIWLDCLLVHGSEMKICKDTNVTKPRFKTFVLTLLKSHFVFWGQRTAELMLIDHVCNLGWS